MSAPLLDPSASSFRVEPPISWPAIFAGAVVSLAIGFVLTTLAAGFGYQVAFPGLASKASLTAFTPIVGAGAVAVQVIAAGLGAYLAGRLRGIWSLAHADESHFRDTAHGLITWALSTVVGAVLAAMVLAPYADHLTNVAASTAPLTATEVDRAANIAAQSFFFMAVGMLLSAFIACVAARIGGMRSEEMHIKTMS